VGSGAKPQPTNDLVHIWAKRNSSGGNSFMDFHRNKFNFLVHLQLIYTRYVKHEYLHKYFENIKKLEFFLATCGIRKSIARFDFLSSQGLGRG